MDSKKNDIKTAEIINVLVAEEINQEINQEVNQEINEEIHKSNKQLLENEKKKAYEIINKNKDILFKFGYNKKDNMKYNQSFRRELLCDNFNYYSYYFFCFFESTDFDKIYDSYDDKTKEFNNKFSSKDKLYKQIFDEELYEEYCKKFCNYNFIQRIFSLFIQEKRYIPSEDGSRFIKYY